MVDVSGFLPVVGSAFVDWLKLFAAPLKNLDMLWIIIPIWSVWIFSEFFQEKKGTSFGNAITNGAVMVFVGVDWIRYIIRQINSGTASFDAEAATKLAISAVIIIGSILIIVLGIRAKGIVKLIGRVRASTYLMLMFSPIIYGVVDFNSRILLTIAAFSPLFYITVEILDRVLPTPQAFELGEEEKLDTEIGKGTGLTGLGSDFGQDGFTQFPQQQQKRR